MPSMSNPLYVRKRITIENTTSRPLTFVLEPWANEYPMAPGARYVIEGDGPSDGAEFYVEQVDDYFVVWAWDGSDARVLHEDECVIADWTKLRVPNFRELERSRREGL